MVLEADAPMHRIGLYSMSQLPLAILGSLASLASGSVSIALVALFHREEPELIVIACSTILSGLIFWHYACFQWEKAAIVQHFY